MEGKDEFSRVSTFSSPSPRNHVERDQCDDVDERRSCWQHAGGFAFPGFSGEMLDQEFKKKLSAEEKMKNRLTGLQKKLRGVRVKRNVKKSETLSCQRRPADGKWRKDGANGCSIAAAAGAVFASSGGTELLFLGSCSSDLRLVMPFFATVGLVL